MVSNVEIAVHAQSHAMRTPAASGESTQVNTPHATRCVVRAEFEWMRLLHSSTASSRRRSRLLWVVDQPFLAGPAQGLCGAVV